MANQPPSPPESARPADVQPAISVLLWGLLVLTILVVLGVSGLQSMRVWVAGPLPPALAMVPPIQLETQDGIPFTEASFRNGKDYHILDFIFTRCGGQCPKMTQAMAQFQKHLVEYNWEDVKLLSVTVDPDNDTTTVLREYAGRFGADLRRWAFLRGATEKVYPWANNGLMLATRPNPGGSNTGGEEFVHSNKFILVDPKGRVRGFYTGTDPDEILRLKEDLKRLRFVGPDAEPPNETLASS
jgi:protein SCO1/2